MQPHGRVKLHTHLQSRAEINEQHVAESTQPRFAQPTTALRTAEHCVLQAHTQNTVNKVSKSHTQLLQTHQPAEYSGMHIQPHSTANWATGRLGRWGRSKQHDHPAAVPTAAPACHQLQLTRPTRFPATAAACYCCCLLPLCQLLPLPAIATAYYCYYDLTLAAAAATLATTLNCCC
jgi:hypothetical protein